MGQQKSGASLGRRETMPQLFFKCRKKKFAVHILLYIDSHLTQNDP